jgi:hypothetical protein
MGGKLLVKRSQFQDPQGLGPNQPLPADSRRRRKRVKCKKSSPLSFPLFSHFGFLGGMLAVSLFELFFFSLSLLDGKSSLTGRFVLFKHCFKILWR